MSSRPVVRNGRPEEALQRACVDILTRFVPPPPKGPAWTAINPVAAKSKAVAGKSKAMGLRKGWPDLEMLFRGASIYVEFKAEKGRVDPSQIAVHEEIVAAGGTVLVVRTVDEFLNVLSAQEIPCRLLH